MVDLPIDCTYENLPQHVFCDQHLSMITKPLVIPSDLSLHDLLIRTFHLLSVGSKRFFVNRFDRSITGLIASQPVFLYFLYFSFYSVVVHYSYLLLIAL